jgi:hypothetical protein
MGISPFFHKKTSIRKERGCSISGNEVPDQPDPFSAKDIVSIPNKAGLLAYGLFNSLMETEPISQWRDRAGFAPASLLTINRDLLLLWHLVVVNNTMKPLSLYDYREKIWEIQE